MFKNRIDYHFDNNMVFITFCFILQRKLKKNVLFFFFYIKVFIFTVLPAPDSVVGNIN